MTQLAWNEARMARRCATRNEVRVRLQQHCEQIASAVISFFVARAEQMTHWHERARQRKVLGELDDRMLRDIGVTRYDAITEAEKPFWR